MLLFDAQVGEEEWKELEGYVGIPTCRGSFTDHNASCAQVDEEAQEEEAPHKEEGGEGEGEHEDDPDKVKGSVVTLLKEAGGIGIGVSALKQ